MAPKDFSEALTNYDDLLGMYTECRLGNNALVDYEQRKK